MSSDIRYFRLMRAGLFVGFKRIIIEYTEPGADSWQLEPVKHDESFALDCAPPGIEYLSRAKLKKHKSEDNS